MKNLLAKLIKDDSGQDVIEYALLAAGISIVAVPTIPTIGTAVDLLYKEIEEALPAAGA